jgi:TctA family transporter
MGTMVEQNFVTSLIKSDGSLLPFFSRPVAAVLAIMSIAAVLWPLAVWVRKPRTAGLSRATHPS